MVSVAPSQPARPDPLRVGIVGLGLVGGSLARALAAHEDVAVVGQDPDPGTRRVADATGIDVVATAAELADALRPGDLVVLAAPLLALGQVAHELATAGLAEGVVVTDVGSVKAPVRAAVAAAGLGDRYVGAHPMAGTEESGFAASSAALLDGATWAVTIDDATPAHHLLRVLELVTRSGGRARVLADAVHDDAVALVSHVPHVLATELLTLVGRSPARELALGLAAGSFRDGTRVARTDPRRTEAMVAGNAAAVARALRVAADDLAGLADALERGARGEPGGAAAVRAFFDEPAPVRRALAAPPEGAGPLVRVDLTRPGWQAQAAALGAAGGVVHAADETTLTVRTEVRRAATPPPGTSQAPSTRSR